jgi:hypothetical protein
MSPRGTYISGAVEGIIDEAVLLRVVRASGGEPFRIYSKRGKAALKQALAGYNYAARFAPWLVILDLDNDADCAPALVAELLPDPSSLMRLRIAVRQIEAWILADAERAARFLGVRRTELPDAPENLLNARDALVNLARRSRSRAIQTDMAPRPDSGRSVGPAYASRLIEFASDAAGGWRPEAAAERAPSLAGCLAAVRTLVQ